MKGEQSNDESGDERSQAVAWLVGVGISGSLLAALFWLGEPGEIWRVLSAADRGDLAVAGACYGVVIVVRWLRLFAFQDSVPRTPNRVELLWVSAGHSFATQLIPARIGELVFPTLWHRATGQSHADGLVALLALRLVELAVLAPLYGIVLFVWLTSGPAQSESVLTGSIPWIAMIVGLLILIGLPLLLHSSIKLAATLVEKSPLKHWRIARPIRDAVPEAQRAAERLGSRNLTWVAVSTTVMWFGLFGVYGYALKACGADLGWVQTIVGSGGGILGNLLPIGAIGSLGVMEAGWTAAFEATGAPLEPVIAAGLLVHAIIIAGGGLPSIVGFTATQMTAVGDDSSS